MLADAGFTYSSSVLPARSPLFGDPTLPTTPFRWPNGLVELPCPVVRAGGVGLPYLGGVYLRALPGRGVEPRPGAASARDQLLWIYCHPYDFDPDEAFWVVPDAGRLGSRLLWYNRRRTFAKIEAMLRGRAGPPLAERLAEVPGRPCRDTEFSQLEMVHRLPPASLVDRFDYLCDARHRSTGRARRLRRRRLPDCSTSSRARGCTSTWPRTASELVGLDLDAAGRRRRPRAAATRRTRSTAATSTPSTRARPRAGRRRRRR